MKFKVITLGCKVNQYESHAIESLLKERGFIPLFPSSEGCPKNGVVIPLLRGMPISNQFPSSEGCPKGGVVQSTSDSGADIYIINTCAVTAESSANSRKIIKKTRNQNPTSFIAVLGCSSQLEPDEIKNLGANIISGTSDRLGFIDEIEKAVEEAQKAQEPSPCLQKALEPSPCLEEPSSCAISPCAPTAPKFEELPPGNTASRTRALLKIQDGCNNFCTYCIVPYIRGRSCSLSLSKIEEYAKLLTKQGYKEIIITGIELSSYGELKSSTGNKQNLTTAIKTISNTAPGVRLRIGSLHPLIITDEFCKELSKIPNLCNHIHISLQSGCDETLKRMGRKYKATDVLKSIDLIRKYFDNDKKLCGITADLITGFPGETDEEFEQTLNFIKQAKFSSMHIFPYSQRPGTKAAQMPNQLPANIKKERAKKAIKIAKEMETEFIKANIGKNLEVLFEQEKDGFSKGHSTNYLEVKVKAENLKNTIKTVKINEAKGNTLTGELV